VITIFKQKNPANLLVLLVTGILIKMPMFMEPHPPVMRPSDGPLYEAIINMLKGPSESFSLFFPVLTYAFLYIQAVVLTRFINNQRMLNKPTYLPGLAYILITTLLPEWNYFSAPLLINTVFLFVLSALFRIYNQPNARGALFNIGLALGIAGFIFGPSFIFIIWILLALLVMRPFRINEWLICLLGVTAPFYFYAVYIVIEGQWTWQKFLPDLYVSLPALKQSLWLSGSVFLLMIPFLTGAYYVQDNLRRMLINIRKGWSLLLLYLLVALLMPFVNTGETFENWIMGAVPLAAFHSCAYLYTRWKIFPHILFWLTVAFILAYQYSDIGPGW
jgi:Family of unknown function (DUF6427)